MSQDAIPLPILPPRAAESHKGDYGRALLIGGSRGMSGAIALAGMAALRGGAGLVKLAVPDTCLDTVATFEPSYMTEPLFSDADGRICLETQAGIAKLASNASCIACGPGLGQSADITKLVAWLYTEISNPLVLDADALNAVATQPEKLASPGGPRILTPHPGEFARLTRRADLSRDQAVELAKQMATDHGIVIVLKGHRTVITDGVQTAVNSTGNPGMATGGSGDVLTGLITAFVCQGLSAFDAAQLAVHVHGLAGDLAAIEQGQVSMIASDLIDHLSAAIMSLVEV